MKPALLLACLLVLAPPAAAQVTKWVDAQGRVHYGDRPPVGKNVAAAPLRGTVSLGDSEASREFATAVAAPRQAGVSIYTTPTCGYCKRAMSHMRRKKVPFAEKDVSANAKNKAEFRAIGGRGVPVTLAGGKRINGYSPEAFDAFLKSAGF
jgi:glutaredoxin